MPKTTSPTELNATVSGSVRNLVVILGDQLDASSLALESFDTDQDAVLMMEVKEESTHVPSHKQRTVLFLSAMRHFALDLQARGFRVRYITLIAPGNTHDFTGEAKRAVKTLKPERITIVEPGEYRVTEMVESWESDLDLPVDIVDDRHFLCSSDSFNEWADGRKEFILEHFYRMMRKRLGVLMDDDGKPTGGQWNFDKDNRKPFKTTPRTPKPYTPRIDDTTQDVIDLVNTHLPDNPGTTEGFAWPVTRDQALRALDKFIDERLRKFGDLQDAMWTGERTAYHSLLSTSLNLKLLDPREVLAAVLDAHAKNPIPLNSLEGFIRQLIGWREFIRGIYNHQGPDYADRNGLDEHGSLPDLYWTGDTDMACMKDCVGQVLDTAYGHHIQRLMVTGNFALIAGVHPREISDWYLAMYADAVDWVTLPNTLGMVMHADGGIVGTKPYAATGKYIKKMSNYCDDCQYDPATRHGDDACPFTTLYWDFLIRHETRFSKNNRMAMMLKHVRNMDREEIVQITTSAKSLKKRLGVTAD